jgi:hypothetical protein
VKNWLRTYRVELLLFVLLWTTYAYFYQATQQNEAARLDQTRAIVQDHGLAINKYWWNSADIIHYSKDGLDRMYPAKAPGMSLLAVPVYAGLSILLKPLRLGGVPEWIYWHVMTHLLVVFIVGLLSALSAVAIYRVLQRVTNDKYFSALIIVAIWMGTLAFPFSTVFFSHQVTASFLAIAFYLLFKLRSEISQRAAGGYAGTAGFLIGFSATTEYPAAILGALLSIYTLWSAWRWNVPLRPKAIILSIFVLGGAIGGGVLIAYNLLAFGKPFYLAYEALAHGASPFPTHTHGWIGFQWLGWKHFLHVVATITIYPSVGLLFLGVRGWWIYGCNPVLWFALPGLALMIWKREWRAEGLLIVAMWFAYFVFISCYGLSVYDWAGASYLGSRHLIPLLPFLTLPLYFGARKLRFLFYPLLGISIFYMLLATAIEPRVPFPHENPEHDFLMPDYLRGKLAQNTSSLFSGERPLTKDSTAANPAKLIGIPGRYQLAPLMLWWLIVGAGIIFATASEEERRAKISSRMRLVFLFVFVSAIALAPIVHYAASPSLRSRHGLLGKYFRNQNWSGQPNDVQVDPNLNFDWSQSWPLPPPFSAEWNGSINIEKAGEYTFSLIADDGALLEIDGRQLVDASHALLQRQSGTIHLGEGSHAIRVRYFNVLFGGSIKLFWTTPDRPEQIIPSDVLLPPPPTPSPSHR